MDAGVDEIEAAMRQVWPGGRDSERRRARGARLLLEHLSGFPGGGWQQRWEASGLNEASRPVNVMIPEHQGRKEICTGAACLFALRVIRPSLLALRSTRFAGYGGRFLEAQRDPLLEEFWKRVKDHPVHPMHHTAALFDVAVALTTQGIALADLTPEAFLHYIWQSRDQGLTMKARGKQNRGQFPGQLAWPVLHEMGLFPPGTPATVRAAVLPGQRTLEELVDRYAIQHQGVRQLILDYLARRRSELDYSSLDQHARSLAGAFWAKIEALSPGHPDLRIDADLYERWREALNTRKDGQGKRHEVERILRSVRSFYLDLHSWAVDEPDKWAPWVAPCPIPDNALRGLTVRKRRTKERIDDRIRRRQPLLPTLVAHLEDRYHHLRELLHHTSPLAPGQTFTFEGRLYQRIWTAGDERRQRHGGQANVRVRDLAADADLNLTVTEELAFWEWATTEVLRHSGIRIEELLELTHLSIRQYQRPNGEVIALLVIAPSKTDRERVIPMSAELFAVIAAIVRRHTDGGRAIPLIQRYDQHERRMSEPMPFLFQRQLGTVRRVISPATVLVMLRRRCAELAEHHPGFQTVGFTPHDFRRLLATELVNNGLPIHIGAALLGHLNLQTTRGYVAVFNEDLVRHYQAYLDRRRQARPTDEYRPVTESEWLGFEEHFDQRKVELGGCARPYGTPCQHEHACLRCPMININPKMLHRLDEIELDLLARRARAEAEGWLGEIEGIDLTLTFLRQKRDQTRRLARVAPIHLGMPGMPTPRAQM
ncbi:site-specific integrase [Nonomuraea sp. NPDC048916]|uniref:tyrosine-type recombinase/integrase n=1 Tax=Nonomuraea sp. NPDC048916 TaxID=3154232 RepID=UPI0033DFE023